VLVRDEAPDDVAPIRALVAAAFHGHPHSRGGEALIIDRLRAAGALALSLVAEREGQVLGHVAFSPVTVGAANGSWFGLGPVAVAPHAQRSGIGTALIRHGLARLRAGKAAGCVVLGEPGYYRRFGFAPDPSLVLPGLPAEYFMALRLGPDPAHGIVTYHPAFGED
jgi:putative acetyltransferase